LIDTSFGTLSFSSHTAYQQGLNRDQLLTRHCNNIGHIDDAVSTKKDKKRTAERRQGPGVDAKEFFCTFSDSKGVSAR